MGPKRPADSGAQARDVSPGGTPKKHERSRGSGRKPGPPPSPDSLHAARTRKEFALADLRVLELRKRQGELLEAADVRRDWTELAGRVRAGMLAVPSRVRSLLPNLTAHDVGVIDAEIRAALSMIAEGIDGCG